MSASRPRVVLVMVECVCADTTTVETAAMQWAQDVRFRHVAPHAATTTATAVVLDGSLATVADVLRAAHEAVNR